MSASLRWMYELVDRTSGPARTIGRQLSLVERQMRDIDRLARQMRLSGMPANDNGIRSLRMQRRHLSDVRAELRERAGPGGSGILGMLGLTGPEGTALGVAFGALTAIGMGAVDVAGDIGHLGMSLARTAVEAADFGDNMEIAFRTLLRGRAGITDPGAAADRVTRGLVHFAGATPFQTGQVMQQGQDVLGGGFSEREMYTILQAAGDISSLHQGNTEYGDRLIELLNRSRGMGRADQRMLREFQSMGGDSGDLTAVLAQRHGMTDTTQNRGRVRQMMSSGQITGSEFNFAALESIRRTRSGGTLGQLMEEQSHTATGLMSTLRSRSMEMFMDFRHTDGYRGMLRFLSTLTELADASTPTGQRIKADLFGVLNRGFRAVFTYLSADRLRGWLSSAVTGAETLGRAFLTAWAYIKPFGSGFVTVMVVPWRMLGAVFRAVAGAMGMLGSGPGQTAMWVLQALGFLVGILVADFLVLGLLVAILGAVMVAAFLAPFAIIGALVYAIVWLVTTVYTYGANIVHGLAQGIRDTAHEAWDAVTELGSGVLGRIRGVFNMHSPSRVMMQLGGFVSEGFAQGIEGGGDRVAGALDGLAPTAGRLGSNVGGRGGAVTIGPIQITVTGHDDPEETGRAVGRGLVAELADAFEQLNLQAT